MRLALRSGRRAPPAASDRCPDTGVVTGVRNQAVTEPASGIVPGLDELVALRPLALRRYPARQGRLGVAGQAPSPVRGRGMEYAESRQYTPGDDARHVDWRLTARSGRLHTKVFQAERERLTLLVADTSPALYFGTRVRFKSVQAARAGALATWLAVRDGDRVAAIGTAVGGGPVAPVAGAKGALRILGALSHWYARAPHASTGLDDALGSGQRLLRPGSRVLVLADPASIVSVAPARWSALSMHNQVLVLLLVDPLESNPPRERLRFRSGDQEVRLDLTVSGQRRAWREAFVDPLDRARETLSACGVAMQVLSTDAPSDAWLPAFSQRGGG